MAARRPFGSYADLLAAAEAVWAGLDLEDLLEAFAAHPKIGDIESLRTKFATTASWAAGEQSGVANAHQATLHGLADGNRDYEAKFGYIFIVCATGKSADDMLTLLRARISNDPRDELEVAAGEQAAITRLRLGKLCR